MADLLKRLVDLVPPPAVPFEAGSEASFAEVETALGLPLPEDYKRLVRTYGTGEWQQFWSVLNPFAANEHTNLLIQCQNLRPKKWSMLDAERGVREAESSHYPHSIYPEPGGILPWAKTDNGGRFFWLTKGSSEQWPTVYYAGRSPNFVLYSIPCVELLYGAVSGDVSVFKGTFDDDFEYGRADAFMPSKPRRQARK